MTNGVGNLEAKPSTTLANAPVKEAPAYNRILVTLTHGFTKKPEPNPSGLKGTDHKLARIILDKYPDVDRYEMQAVAGGRTRLPRVDSVYTCFVDPQGESFRTKDGRRVITSRSGDEVVFRPKDEIIYSDEIEQTAA